jgi:predicted nuclease of predicted toxin-antitoxin system
MRFLVDANLPRAAVAALQRFGHEVQFARDVGLADAPDEKIDATAIRSAAALLSRDMDFADIRRYPPERRHGIVVLRLSDTATAPQIVSVLERFLAQRSLLESLPGRLAIVEFDLRLLSTHALSRISPDLLARSTPRHREAQSPAQDRPGK